MIINCQKCSTRLQVDETKIHTRPFIIRCPKCNTSVESEGLTPATEQSAPVAKAPANGGAPANGSASATGAPAVVRPPANGSAPGAATAPAPSPEVDQSTPAPLFESAQKNTETNSAASAAERLAELLAGLLNQPAATGRGKANARRSWDPRKALLCVPESNRESIARGLAEQDYQVFVAEDTRQAVDRMRENEVDVVLLDSRFDPSEQGAIFVTREVNILRPAQRRRLFFVLLSPTMRTMDAHAAFLSNVNAIININELEELPKLLERRLNEFNAIYREYNVALGTTAL